jgi:hypothetical protein
LIWGDLLCDGAVGAEDVVAGLAYLAQVAGPDAADGCPSIGAPFLVGPAAGAQVKWGDTDCDGTLGPTDDLSSLLFGAELEPLPHEVACPAIGAGVFVTSLP